MVGLFENYKCVKFLGVIISGIMSPKRSIKKNKLFTFLKMQKRKRNKQKKQTNEKNDPQLQIMW